MCLDVTLVIYWIEIFLICNDILIYCFTLAKFFNQPTFWSIIFHFLPMHISNFTPVFHFKHCTQTYDTCIVLFHDDVTKWKHFPRYWPFVRGIHRWPVNSPHKGQWRGYLMFSLICAWINGRVNNREAGDLRRYRAHYDVTVMSKWHPTPTPKMKEYTLFHIFWSTWDILMILVLNNLFETRKSEYCVQMAIIVVAGW